MPDGKSARTHACMTVSRQAVTSSGLHACKPANRTESKPSCRRACMHAVRTVSQPASMTACQPARFHGERSPKHRLGETSGDELLCERDSAHVLGGMPSQSFNCVESAVYGRRRRVLTGGWDPTRRAAGTPGSTHPSAGMVPSPRVPLSRPFRAWDVTGDAPPGADHARTRCGIKEQGRQRRRDAHDKNSRNGARCPASRGWAGRGPQCSEGR